MYCCILIIVVFVVVSFKIKIAAFSSLAAARLSPVRATVLERGALRIALAFCTRAEHTCTIDA